MVDTVDMSITEMTVLREVLTDHQCTLSQEEIIDEN